MNQAIGALLAVEVGGGYIAGGVGLWLITNVITWVISAKVTTAVLIKENEQLRKQIDELTEGIKSLVKDVKELAAAIADAREDRQRCELRALKTYATQEQFVQIGVQVADLAGKTAEKADRLSEKIRESVSKAHARIDAAAERITRMEATQQP